MFIFTGHPSRRIYYILLDCLVKTCTLGGSCFKAMRLTDAVLDEQEIEELPRQCGLRHILFEVLFPDWLPMHEDVPKHRPSAETILGAAAKSGRATDTAQPCQWFARECSKYVALGGIHANTLDSGSVDGPESNISRLRRLGRREIRLFG
jgi:hypothetical protein